MPESPVGQRAEQMANNAGGFPAQSQEPPGSTKQMDPVPDHGEDTYEGSGKLEGLRAVVTGGDSGIGRAVAIAFAREGADVARSYLPDEQEDAEDTAEWVRKAGRTAVLCPGDLMQEAVCQELIDKTVQELGGLDILVNKAGAQWARDSSLDNMSTERINRIFKTKLYALTWVTKAVLPHLAKGASITNVSSIQAYDPCRRARDPGQRRCARADLDSAAAGDQGGHAQGRQLCVRDRGGRDRRQAGFLSGLRRCRDCAELT